MDKVKKGYYIMARIIEESKISQCSPCTREIWHYLIRNANHSPQKYNGYKLKRGQLFRSYKEIQDDLSWSVGYRKQHYGISQIKHSMALLSRPFTNEPMNEPMIELTKEPRGVIITICKYDYYQDIKNYEGTNEGTNEGATNSLSINKELKALKELKENTPLPEFLISRFRKKGFGINEAQSFVDFYSSKGWKVGKEPMVSWVGAVGNWCKGKEPDLPYHEVVQCPDCNKKYKPKINGMKAKCPDCDVECKLIEKRYYKKGE